MTSTDLEQRRAAVAGDDEQYVADPHVGAERFADAVLFAGEMSHDLRVPLGSISTSTQSLMSMPSLANDLTAQRMLRGQLRALRRAEQLVEAVVEFARHGDRVHAVDLDLDELVGTVLGDLAPMLTASRADVVVKDLPVVHADPAGVYSVVLNLVMNAVRFARPGVPPFIALTCDRRGDWWRIFVTDNGAGISADQRARIFEPFTRTDSAGSGSGSGMGLATAKRAVEAHGGRIGVESGRAGGTEFWFELPMLPRAAPTIPGVRDGHH